MDYAVFINVKQKQQSDDDDGYKKRRKIKRIKF